MFFLSVISRQALNQLKLTNPAEEDVTNQTTKNEINIRKINLWPIKSYTPGMFGAVHRLGYFGVQLGMINCQSSRYPGKQKMMHEPGTATSEAYLFGGCRKGGRHIPGHSRPSTLTWWWCNYDVHGVINDHTAEQRRFPRRFLILISSSYNNLIQISKEDWWISS